MENTINTLSELKKILNVSHLYITSINGAGIIKYCFEGDVMWLYFDSFNSFLYKIRRWSHLSRTKYRINKNIISELTTYPIMMSDDIFIDKNIKKTEDVHKIIDWPLINKEYVVESILSFLLKEEETIFQFRTLCKNLFLEVEQQVPCTFYDMTSGTGDTTDNKPYLSTYISDLATTCYSKSNLVLDMIGSDFEIIKKKKKIPKLALLGFKYGDYEKKRVDSIVENLLKIGVKNILIYVTMSPDSIYESDDFITNELTKHKNYYDKILKKSLFGQNFNPNNMYNYFDIDNFFTPLIAWSNK